MGPKGQSPFNSLERRGPMDLATAAQLPTGDNIDGQSPDDIKSQVEAWEVSQLQEAATLQKQADEQVRAEVEPFLAKQGLPPLLPAVSFDRPSVISPSSSVDMQPASPPDSLLTPISAASPIVSPMHSGFYLPVSAHNSGFHSARDGGPYAEAARPPPPALKGGMRLNFSTEAMKNVVNPSAPASPHPSPALEADQLMRRGHAANQQGRYAEARAYFLEARMRDARKLTAQVSAANMALKVCRQRRAPTTLSTLGILSWRCAPLR